MINVIIVDNEVILGESIKYRLNGDSDINVIGCIQNESKIIKLCTESNVNVLLIDIKIPNFNKIDLIKFIKNEFKNIKIIVITTSTSAKDFKKAILYGVDGYVLKDITPNDLINTIKNVNSSLKVINGYIFRNVLKSDIVLSEAESNEEYNLTEKEFSIVKYIIQGKSTNEIAEKMFLSEGRIRNIIFDILKKLKLKNRVQLAVFAIKNNIV